jgi:BTB/POZ domain-containing protein KCTD9
MYIFLRKFCDWLIDAPIRFYSWSFLLVSIILLIIDSYCSFFEKDGNIDGVLTEAHGMLLDIIVFGILLAIYDKFKGAKEDIKRYKEEIDDFRPWKSEEASHRIAGIIKRLNKLEFYEIRLSYCYLNKANLEDVKLKSVMLKTSLEATCLDSAELTECKLKEINASNSKCRWTKFSNCQLDRVDFTNAVLNEAIFYNCFLNEVSFEFAELKNVDCRGMIFRDSKSSFRGAIMDGAKADESQRNYLQTLGADTSKIIFS